MQLLNKISRNRKKIFSLIFFFFLAISLPITSYFVISEDAFDRRSEAASFNALVQDFEVFLDQAPDYIPGVIRLEFPEHVPSAEIERIIGGPRTTPADLLHTPFERVEYIRVDGDNMASEMAKYEMYYPTKSVDLDYIPRFWWRSDGANRVVPIDWNSGNHWYFDKIKLPEVWKLQGCDRDSKNCGGSKDVVVAVHDSGMAFNAPEVQGMNMFSHPSYNRNNHVDRHGHGTYVAGVIASTVGNVANSPVGMAHNLTIMPVNAHIGIPGAEGVRERSLYYTAEHADVINMSWGYEVTLQNGRRTTCFDPPTYLNTFFNHAYNNGVVVVAASGNTYDPCVGYPASNPRVIAVGSTNSNNSRSSYSNYGEDLDFVAPVGQGTSAGGATWQQTFSCVPDCGSGSNLNSFSNKYLRGTSFAAPQVAGAAGLILSLDSSLTPAQVKQVLIDTVDNIGSRTQFGYGLLNLENIYKHFGEVPDPDPDPEEDKYPKQVKAIYDFTGNGNAEILWQHDEGQVVAWYMDGVRKMGESQVTTVNPAWQLKAVYDLTGDGNPEILWQHDDGRVTAWHMRDGVNWDESKASENSSRIATVGSGWNLKAVYDLTGDGNAEILWQHDDGRVTAWHMRDGVNWDESKASENSSRIATVSLGWDLKAVYDLTGDGNPEILWQHDDGRISVWYLDNFVRVGSENIARVQPGWEIKVVYDVTRNDKVDIIWQHSDGRVTLWHMEQDGLTRENGTNIYPEKERTEVGGGWAIEVEDETCTTNSDCQRENPPYEVCHKNVCIKGDITNDERIGMNDFAEFKKDFISFKANGWDTNLMRSDFNKDNRISMGDYSIFVNSYRLVGGLD